MIYIFSMSLFSLYLALTRFKIWSPASFFSIFLFLQIILYFLFLNNLVPQSAYTSLPLPYDLIGVNKKETLSFYLVLLSFFSFLLLFIKKERPKDNAVSTANLIDNVPRKYIAFASILILLLTLNYLIDMKWSVVLEHAAYLDAANVKKLELSNGFSIIFNNSVIFFFILTTTFYFICKKRNFIFEKNILLIILVFLFLVVFARASRAIIFMVIFYGACDTIILKKKWSIFKSVIYVLFCGQLFFTVIGIRGKEFGGLMHIVPNFFDISSLTTIDKLFTIYQNVFFGVMNFDIALNYNPQFSTIHKFLSNSPLLSVMDGFREISEEFVYRINVYTPFGSYAESYHFGIFFLVYFCFLQILNIFLVSIKTNSANFLFYLPATVFSYLSIIYSTQYSVRTSTKYIFLSYIFLFAASYYLKKYKQNKTPSK